ncbi:L,D-transpeptidase [Nocardioides dubius]|uniref:L,D-TPase catalytic domain-containing protein n=2 Tax=Nocardioides dubius TaxID=317019 RepID=A0ABN1TTI2_9ACTN
MGGSIVGTGLAVSIGVAAAPVEMLSEVTAAEERGRERRDLSAATAVDGERSQVAPQARAVLEPGRVLAPKVPAGSGEGRRVVFSQSDQRVWLVRADGTAQRTYLVSGSVYDNLDPGSYRVFSRSEQAWGIDDSGTMRWFVRFAQGPNAAIGFHDIPLDDGKRVQTPAQLGTPLSHGCVRQRTTDALALWEFAPLGTSVVVVA